ncbi:MAG: benzoate-CoA ligase family protein [Planctomycetota bacterium]|jgi:benzoate-CoA ligase family protein
MSDIYDAVPPFPARFNLCTYFLDHNLDAGRGNKVALIVGDETRTYAQLSDRAARMAAALRRAGVRPEERVLIILPDGFEFAEAFFGTLRAGAVFAMVNPLLKAKDFEYALRYTKARVVITASSVLPELAAVAEAAPLCETVFVVGDDIGGFSSLEVALGMMDPASPEAAVSPTGPDDLAGWLFTSGSTGEPKACVHTQADFAYSTETYALQVVGYREDDICLSVPKLFFGYATGTNLMFPFRVGATAVLFPGRATADELLDQIEAHRPTFLTCVPTMTNNLLRSARVKDMDLSSLRISLSAGEALPPKLYEDWMARTGIEMLDGIGSAEMFHIYVSNRPGDVKLGSLGKVVPGYEAVVVDPNGKLLPDGQSGRLRMRGGSTAICYWADKAKSRETFQGEWCTSADVFRRDEEGYFWYEGRSDDLIKVSGIWTSPLEIENALLAHEGVAQVCVLGKEDQDQLVKPVAFVVCSEGTEGCDELAADLKAWLKDRLAPHKYPRWFEWRSDLPKNDRGKVARKELRAELEGGAA